MNAREEWHLDTKHLGRRVLVYDSLDSTSSRAVQFADDPTNDGLAILADVQTAGRGQYGRSWVCQRGVGVLLSVLLYPPPALRRPAILTAWAAVSVCELILEVTGLQACIKWPNDVLIQGRKVCGILIEQSRGTVAGIGLNVNQTAASFAEAGLTEAASLSALADKSFDVAQVAQRLIEHLDAEYSRLRDGDLATLEAGWTWRVGLLGREVLVECPGVTHRGRLCEMTFDALELQQSSGEPLRLIPETVRHIASTQSTIIR